MRFSRELRNRLPATCDKRAGGWYPPAAGTCLSSATAAGEKWFAVPFLRLDSNQRGEDFPSARGTKNLCLAEGVSPRGYLLVHDLERTFRLDSNQRGEDFPSARGTIITSAYKSLLLWTRHSGVTVFPSARGSKNRYPAEGVSPRGYWFESEERI